MLIRNVPRAAALLPRLAWLRLRVRLLCRMMGTTPAEFRRQMRLRELTGRPWVPPT